MNIATKTRTRLTRWNVLLGAAVSMSLAGTYAHGYEVRTHERLTLRAFSDSILSDTEKGPLAALEIDDAAVARWRSIPPSDLDPVVTSARGLVGLGAIYEDHPWPTVHATQWRFLRHFFDPQQGGKGLGIAWSSRDWILEHQDIAEQQFSLPDTHQHYLDALTMRDKAAREQRTILLLQGVGRIVHHLQDMAQPAHTRDDMHPYPLDDDPYEAYTEEQFWEKYRPLPTAFPCGEAPINLSQFDEFGKFWAGENRGLAEFSSTNFVSQDTNFILSFGGGLVHPTHPQPAFPANPVYEDTTLAQLGISHPLSSLPVRFLSLPIVDGISGGGCTQRRATTLSVFSHDLQSLATPGYTLNKFNFEENYRILFPRAIAYSVGMMNYFFRGRLQLESYTMAGTELEVVVRNDSEAQFALSGLPTTGAEEFSVYYDSASGERRRLALRGDDIGSTRIEHGQTHTLSFPIPEDVDTRSQNPFTLVFNGTIGKEPGIAALRLGPRNGGILVTPNYAVSDGVAGARVISMVQGSWQLSPQAGAVAGNVDWRGHGADEVLTWHGPKGRYFSYSGVVGSSPNIYRGGKVLAVAPGGVLGAAISKIGGQRYLVAGVAGWAEIEIYRRPYQASYAKHGLYDPLNNPLGWERIGRTFSWATSPLFFNASGTEGQVFGGSLHRYKVRISGAGASIEMLSNVGSIRRIYQATHDPTASVDVSPGPPLECKARGTECVGARGTCTDEQTGAQYGNVCLVAQAREDVSRSSTTTSTWTYDNITSTVVCADYRGDTEILCLVEQDETLGTGRNASVGRWQSTQTWKVEGVCTPKLSGPVSYVHDYDVDENFRVVMTLRVGSKTIPLSGSVYNRTKRYHSEMRNDWSLPAPAPTVSWLREDHEIEYDNKLLHVDARNEVIIYEEHVRREDTVGSGTATAHPPNYYPQDWYFFAPSETNVVSTSRTIVDADRQYVLSTNSAQQQPEFPNYVENTGYQSVGINYCSDDPSRTDTDDRTQEWNVHDFWKSVHPQIDSESTSVSILSPSAFVASIPLWVRQPDKSYVQDGQWNHLSGGNLGTLLPPGTANPTYAPTGIVK